MSYVEGARRVPRGGQTVRPQPVRFVNKRKQIFFVLTLFGITVTWLEWEGHQYYLGWGSLMADVMSMSHDKLNFIWLHDVWCCISQNFIFPLDHSFIFLQTCYSLPSYYLLSLTFYFMLSLSFYFMLSLSLSLSSSLFYSFFLSHSFFLFHSLSLILFNSLSHSLSPLVFILFSLFWSTPGLLYDPNRSFFDGPSSSLTTLMPNITAISPDS